jgi:hypothetical protein
MDNGLYQSNASQTAYENPACEVDVRNFRNCMDENQGNLSICGWYLDQLVCLRFCFSLPSEYMLMSRRKLARLPLSLTKGLIPI